VTDDPDDPSEWAAALGRALLRELSLSSQEASRIEDAIRTVMSPWIAAAIAGRRAARVAHEVRNPLAVIATSAALLEARSGHDPAVQRHARRIALQTAIAADLVSSLLAAGGPRGPRIESVALATIVEEACEGVSLPRDITVVRRADSGFVRADRAWTRQILVNLLRNAAEACEGRGEIRVQAAIDGPLGRVRVEDDGPGVPEALRSELFREGVGRRHGVGLALSRGLALGQRGELSLVQTEAGATFELTLPADGSP
jgi:two-component system sensor histidine kinase HydH